MRTIISPSWASISALALIFSSLGVATAAESDNAAGAENLFTKNYVSKGNPVVALQPDPAAPRIYQGNDKVQDYQRTLENGYDMIGSSDFEAADDIGPDKLKEQAKKVKADLVLVYTKLTGSVPASVKVQQMREQARKAQKNPDDSAGVLLPEEHGLYSYFASYWVKLAPPIIGVHVTSTGEGDSVTGLKVIAVVKDSPAAKAALQQGDILTRIGEVELTKPEALSQAAKQYAGQTVEVAWQRDGEASKTSIALNKRP